MDENAEQRSMKIEIVGIRQVDGDRTIAAFDLAKAQLTLSKAERTVLSELDRQTDRGLGVLGGALIDDMLKAATTCFWRSDTKDASIREARDLLLKDGGAFTFGVKIAMAFVDGLVGPTVYSDLKLLKGLRNDFSHLVETKDSHRTAIALDFNTPSIKDRCKNFKLVDKVTVAFLDEATLLPVTTARERYLATTLIIYTALLLWLGNPKKEAKFIDHVLKC